MEMNLAEIVEKNFREFFNEEPLIIRSPGRVNLIGEHTDYNMGFVLPAAIDKAVYFAISKREDNLVILVASDLDESHAFSIESPEKSEKIWANYLVGVVDQLNKAGYKLNGFNCVFGGDIPIGAGLSSSAAIEAGLAFALNLILDLNIDKLQLVKFAQKAENEFVGVNCGIMDQYINIFGKQGHVLRIDCRSLEYEYVPFDFKNISVVLFNTNVTHSLSSSEYNQRRKECSNGVSVIKNAYPEVESLRDVSKEMLESVKEKLDAIVYNRCKYVVDENNRIMDACALLEKEDLQSFGKIMYQTHEGLSKLYSVSCDELDYLVNLTHQFPEVYGARMMGGGFGGCTINLIENDAIERISSFILSEYKDKFGIEADVYVTSITAGTELVSHVTQS